MGKKLTPAEEAEVLREVTREAHGVLKDLTAALREAKALAPKLVNEFQELHEREIRQISNYFTDESNRQAAQLNQSIDRARKAINEEIMAGEACFDPRTALITIRWGQCQFDDDAPLPYPNEQTPEQHP